MFGPVKEWFDSDTPPAQEQCACCDRCCAIFGWRLFAIVNDLQRWRRENRTDLLSRVNRLGWIWVGPVTKEMEERCPFIVKISGLALVGYFGGIAAYIVQYRLFH